MEKRLVPFSLYLPPDLHRKLKQAAKQRKASQLVRDGIKLILDGGDHYKSGYNQAIKDQLDPIPGYLRCLAGLGRLLQFAVQVRRQIQRVRN